MVSDSSLDVLVVRWDDESMSRWPTVDPLRRARVLAELRRADTRRSAMATPATRIERMFDLMTLASLLGTAERSNSDESVEDWRRMRAHLREADARR